MFLVKDTVLVPLSPRVYCLKILLIYKMSDTYFPKTTLRSLNYFCESNYNTRSIIEGITLSLNMFTTVQ